MTITSKSVYIFCLWYTYISKFVSNLVAQSVKAPWALLTRGSWIQILPSFFLLPLFVFQNFHQCNFWVNVKKCAYFKTVIEYIKSPKSP